MVQVIDGASDAQKEKKQQEADAVITKMRHISEEEEASSRASSAGVPYADLNLMPINSDEVRLLREEDARQFLVGLFWKRGKVVRLAAADAMSDATRQFVHQLEREKGWSVHLYGVSRASLLHIWSRYADTSLFARLDTAQMRLSDDDLKKFRSRFGDILKLHDRIEEIPTTEVLSTIIAGAINLRASDIHFEPQEKQIRLRYRLDGVLQDVGDIPHSSYHLILSRVKMMGKMKINVRSRSQGGHFSISINGVEKEDGRVDVRASIIPSHYGESIVLRLLNEEDILLQIEDLGLRGLALEEVRRQIAKPNGMIINTGPTGSGKTTTLYAFLNKLNAPGVKIITIEDPVEYEIAGIEQTEVSSSGNDYTFAKGLRAIVRQDPDIILVGEIRDDETADIAINAALTGHLVFSTLHTNDAAGSVPRLLELGVKPALIAPATNVFIAQRLVRRLCEKCKESYEPARETIDTFKRILSLISPKSNIRIPKEIRALYRAIGCEACNHTGYRGRIGIFEVIVMNENLQKMIENMANDTEIARAAIEEGMITMTQDGILKAVEGITSMEEVWRVAGEADLLENMYDQLMEQSLGRALFIPSGTVEVISPKIGTKEKFSHFFSSVSAEKLAETVFVGAFLFGANDVHFEPREDMVSVRFRLDGILEDMGEFPLAEYPSVLGKIKLLSGLKTGERAHIADGRFSLTLEAAALKEKETSIDIRVSIITGGYGETAVLRFLNTAAVALDMEKLGIRKENLAAIRDALRKPNGILLNTGPTGSGKTTTLYSILKSLNTPDAKIMTVEDPIEYRLDGVLQTQVNDEEGYTFANALRSLLRQNPNILMVGEIRDDETAAIAVQAALTGHSVFSTLHANNATAAVARLANMGIRADDIATAINACAAQRLVRVLCECKVRRTPTSEEKKLITEILASISPVSGVAAPKNISEVFTPSGCDKCRGIGYRGRTVISEVLMVDEEMRALIAGGALAQDIQKKAVEKGMLTMEQDGILKVVEGITSLEEVKRVTDL